MQQSSTTDSQYPVGRFDFEAHEVTPDDLQTFIDGIASLPARLRTAVAGLDEAMLQSRYREGGWTIRQLVHHLLDSHLNAYLRTRLALTEHEPMIRPYQEAAWAELPDAVGMPLEPSLMAVEGLHARWVELLRAIGPDDFARPLRHPDWSGARSVAFLVHLYDWHGRHHLAHIAQAKRRGSAEG